MAQSKAKKIIEIDGNERFAVEFDELVRLSEETKIPLRRLKIAD